MTTGKRIAQKRKELMLSQEMLGEQLNVSRQSIYKWEADLTLPEVDKLIALSKLFGVSIGWLLGVEQQSKEEQVISESSELSEAQIKMIKEISAQYIQASESISKPKKQNRWFILIVLILAILLLQLYLKINDLNQQTQRLSNSMHQVETNLEYQMGGLSNRVETILKEQNNLITNSMTELVAVNLEENLVTISFQFIPTTFKEGMTASIRIENEGLTETHGPLAAQESAFSGTVTTVLSDHIELYAVLESDQTQKIQYLDTYDFLLSGSFPSLMLEDAGVSLIAAEVKNNVLELRNCYLTISNELQNEEMSRFQSQIKSIQVGLFKNQELLEWAVPCEQPDTFNGFEAYQFYRLSDQSIVLNHEDELSIAAKITDSAGRTVLYIGTSYCLDKGEKDLSYGNRQNQYIFEFDSWKLHD